MPVIYGTSSDAIESLKTDLDNLIELPRSNVGEWSSGCIAYRKGPKADLTVPSFCKAEIKTPAPPLKKHSTHIENHELGLIVKNRQDEKERAIEISVDEL